MRYVTKAIKTRLGQMLQFPEPQQSVPWQILFKLLPPHQFSPDEYTVVLNAFLSNSIVCSKSELLRLVEFLLDVSKPKHEADGVLGVLLFNKICVHPQKSDLIYYWMDFFESEPSASEIVDLATAEYS